MSHLGRPKGIDPELSLGFIAKTVAEILGTEVIFAKDSVGEDAQTKAANLTPGQVLLIENLRFHAEETKGDETFAKALSTLGDLYVNDAFGTAHRAHASTAIIASYFTDNKCFGSLLEQEAKAIEKVLNSDDRPVLAILGGLKFLKNHDHRKYFDKIDDLIIEGMAYTFIKAQGGKVGDSL